MAPKSRDPYRAARKSEGLNSQGLNRRLNRGLKSGLNQPLQHGFPPRRGLPPKDGLSAWKIGRKNRTPRWLQGGDPALDALYDSRLKPDRISPCPTLKMTSPATSRRPPIFVPSPSSMR